MSNEDRLPPGMLQVLWKPVITIALTSAQFAPQVGDVDNNLNRADAVLSKANPQNLDILVLPELAFSGTFRFCVCCCMAVFPASWTLVSVQTSHSQAPIGNFDRQYCLYSFATS